MTKYAKADAEMLGLERDIAKFNEMEATEEAALAQLRTDEALVAAEAAHAAAQAAAAEADAARAATLKSLHEIEATCATAPPGRPSPRTSTVLRSPP